MATTDLLYLYREARLNLEPAYPGSVISLSLPSQVHSTFGSRPQGKRTILNERYTDQDEEALAKRHLASEASVFFRTAHRYPRSFLWRILEDGKTLEIQSIDLEHDFDNKYEANLTLLLQFPSAIRPFGLAFAELDDRDALNVFAVTVANELYTLTLHREFFCKATATEVEISDWCKSIIPSSFSIRHPYRLFALDPNNLLVSLSDGAIQRFSKKKNDDGSSWAELGLKENSWSLKGLVSWGGRNTVRFNNAELESNSAAGVALSPDGKHIFTVCLNHTLKAWNLETGKVGVQTDLLGENDRPHDKVAPYLIGPSQSTLLKVIDIPGGIDGAEYYVLTYSPKKHEFKFWAIRDADSAELGFAEVQPDIPFVPPVDDLMNTTVWNLEEFHFKSSGAGWRNAELWIRARSGPSSKVYTLTFNIQDDPDVLEHAWKYEWVAVDAGPLTIEGLKNDPANPAEQSSEGQAIHSPSDTEQWLEFLFAPGRFTIATLETALFVYRRALAQKTPADSSSKGTLKERIVSSVSAYTTRRGASAEVDYDEYEEAVSAQWDVYYGLVRDLHKRRGESLSLAFDYEVGMPWLVLSDYISAIRAASQTEIVQLNSDLMTSSEQVTAPLHRAIKFNESDEVTRLLNGASVFRSNLPTSFKDQFTHSLEIELLHTPSVSVIDRMAAIEGRSNLVDNVSDDDLENLLEELSGSGIRDISNALIFRALELLDQPDEGKPSRDRKQITRYGLHALSRISIEQLELARNILLDLLVLTLFVQFDDPDNLPDAFDGESIFVELVEQLKDNMIFLWLNRTVWSRPAMTSPASKSTLTSLKGSFKGNDNKLPIVQTVMQGILGQHSHVMPFPNWPLPQLLTYWARTWPEYPTRELDYEHLTEHVMGILLEQKEYDLAVDFSKFLGESNWATYLKGRVHLEKGEYSLASGYFQKAAYSLARGMFSLDDVDRISLIPLDQRDLFSDGLPRYYSHILGLFEKAKAYSFVADFAKLGLQTLLGPARNEALKTDLLSRLFNASIQTSRFEEAYSALGRLSNEQIRKSSLTTFVTSLIAHSRSSLLLSLPFTTLHNEIDSILSSLAQKTLNISSGPPYHQLLYSFRISRNDYRGAAQILYDRLQRLKSSSSQIHNPADESLVHTYLMIINTLANVGEEDRWILAEQGVEEGSGKIVKLGQGKVVRKRAVVGIEDLRGEYQRELDRVADVELGNVPFLGGGDEMDVL